MYECEPDSELAGPYVVRDGGAERRINLARDGHVHGDIRGASRWGVLSGQVILKRADDVLVARCSRNGETWVDSVAKWEMTRPVVLQWSPVFVDQMAH